MTDKIINAQNYQCLEPPFHPNRLMGKVVLLIGSDTAVIRSLVAQLAQKGADIVLVCRYLSNEAWQHLRERVESWGSRLLLIEETNVSAAIAGKLVHEIINQLGRLDFLMDLSTLRESDLPDNAYGEARQPQWQLMRTALEEMASP